MLEASDMEKKIFVHGLALGSLVSSKPLGVMETLFCRCRVGRWKRWESRGGRWGMKMANEIDVACGTTGGGDALPEASLLRHGAPDISW